MKQKIKHDDQHPKLKEVDTIIEWAQENCDSFPYMQRIIFDDQIIYATLDHDQEPILEIQPVDEFITEWKNLREETEENV